VHRKAARRPAHVSLDATGTNDVLELRIPEHQEPASELQAASEHAHIIRILDGLPERYARVLEAKYGDGMSVEEMARELGLSSIAVQSLLARAREAFRDRWQKSASGEVHLGSPS
jgi:RNA polymerase sigma factor (sigma-70 family)